MSERILADLNEPQREAVTHVDGPLLVLAGPGSGKTRVITRRCAYLVQSGIRADNILAITFTNKAAGEMRRRIEELGVGRNMWIYTFHALGARLLREFGPLAKVAPGFTIFDDSDQKRVIKDAMLLCDVDPNTIKPEQVAGKISKAKDQLLTPEEYEATVDFADDQLVARLYLVYQRLLEQQNAVDFDDLLMRVAIVLRDHPAYTARLNERFRYVLIDEYQDTNHAQYLIARCLSQHHRNVCATGDPDQSIYGWRGANISNILDFEQDYPNARVVRLEQNYRSTGNVLKVASALIRHNQNRKHKDLWTENDDGGPVDVWKFAEGRDEAERIATRIAQLHREGLEYAQIAICYRVNAISRGLEEALRMRGIPYRIARGLEFYNRKEIKDTLAYLHVLANPADSVALRRIINTPGRGIGKTTIDRVMATAEQEGMAAMDVVRQAARFPVLRRAAGKLAAFVDLIDRMQPAVDGPLSELVETVLERSGLEAMYKEEDFDGEEDRLANLAELVSAAARYEDEEPDPSLPDFLQRISLTSDQDAIDETAGAVLLMTLHAAKGLEFNTVFIAGVEQGLLPHERSLRLATGGEVEEERRLFFVGITRAMQRLTISHCDERFLRGVMTARIPSEFLRELPTEVLNTEVFGHAISRGGLRPRGGDFDFGDDDFDQRPPRRVGRERSSWQRYEEPTFSPDDPAGQSDEPVAPPPQEYADWRPGTIVQHEAFGVGRILWVRGSAGNTRASIRFAGVGEKTFILDMAPITRIG